MHVKLMRQKMGKGVMAPLAPSLNSGLSSRENVTRDVNDCMQVTSRSIKA